MHTDAASALMTGALITAAQLLAPLLIAILVTGLLVSVLQVATQIQEMTLTFVPKLVVAGAVLMLLGGWMLETLASLATRSLATAIHAWQ